MSAALSNLEREGLVGALERQAAAVQARHGLQVRMEVGGEPDMPAAAKEALKYLGTAEAQNIYLKSDPSDVGANTKADSAGYNALQKKAAEFIGNAKQISQFLDRDANPTFGSIVLARILQKILHNERDVSLFAGNI